MKPSLQLRIGQQLTMTPQLQQAIRLLQLPVLELDTQLQQALAENVMLEMDEPAEREPDPEDSPVVAQESSESGIWSDLPAGGGRADIWGDDSRRPELADRSDESLREHLLWQLEMEHFTPREMVIGHAIVDYLNDDGYLTESLESIQTTLAGEASFSLEEIEAALRKVQALDPAGIAARDLSECIRIQLSQLDAGQPGRDLAIEIARASLDLVADQQYPILRRRLGVSDEALDVALALVRSCHPRPGAAVQSSTAEYVVPDVYVRKLDGKWVVEVNRSAAPRLKVNQTYAAMLRGNGEHATLRTQLQEARWLVRSLEIRHETLLKVAMCIVERQADFLEHGEEEMKPMILRDVAEAIEMHESTISRVTSNKYMHTPRGVIEFRYFFSSQLTGSDGTEQSSTAIRAKIRKLIGHENPAKPLSDSGIAKLLADDGVRVARRTVAKYRETMRIAPSTERKRHPAR
jgi:RNA polymerase sigma-54 factor